MFRLTTEVLSCCKFKFPSLDLWTSETCQQHVVPTFPSIWFQEPAVSLSNKPSKSGVEPSAFHSSSSSRAHIAHASPCKSLDLDCVSDGFLMEWDSGLLLFVLPRPQLHHKSLLLLLLVPLLHFHFLLLFLQSQISFFSFFFRTLAGFGIRE